MKNDCIRKAACKQQHLIRLPELDYGTNLYFKLIRSNSEAIYYIAMIYKVCRQA